MAVISIDGFYDLHVHSAPAPCSNRWLLVFLLAITYMAPLALALPNLFGYGR